jgi:hypothetical protein
MRTSSCTPTTASRLASDRSSTATNARRTLARRSLPIRTGLVAFIEEGIADESIAACDPLVAATWVLHTLVCLPEELCGERDPKRVCQGVFASIRRGLAGAV